jgi:hypothetical protein
MGLRTMCWDEWIELDNEFLHYHELKARRYVPNGEMGKEGGEKADFDI